jgi:hypothetical protein
MSSGLIELIKRASLDAIDNAKMCDLRYGEVVSTSPLKIKITNQFVIPSSLLVVPKRLRDDDPLVNGDKVVLIRQQGGQSYFILDKI